MSETATLATLESANAHAHVGAHVGAHAEAHTGMEPDLKLVVTILVGYLVAVIYHQLVSKRPAASHHLYFIATGACMYYWNFGTDIYHQVLCVLVQWLLMRTLGGSRLCVALSFVFQLGYYLVGLQLENDEEYAINWLIPHCIIVLRMIGLAWDLYDGSGDTGQSSAASQERALTGAPTILELFSVSFFPGSFMVGPQYPLTRMRALVNGEFDDETGTSTRYKAAGKQLLIGLVSMAMQQFFSGYFYIEHLLTPEFQDSSFPSKVLCVTATGHVIMFQYLCVWTINDGVCILTGMGHDRDAKTGELRWTAVQNAVLPQFFTCTSFRELLGVHNINTNDWVKNYVFKRCRFLGSRTLSQGITMLFLAMWHGYHTGYFTAFAYQLLLMNSESLAIECLSGSQLANQLREDGKQWLLNLFGCLYFHLVFGYVMIDFTLLHWHVYKPVYDSVFWFGHVFYASVYVFFTVYKHVAGSPKSEKTKANVAAEASVSARSVEKQD